ncbi:hypothetical protein [Actinoplanes sp. NPDC023714]
MAKFEHLTFPDAEPDARLAHVIVPAGRISRREAAVPEDRPALTGTE